MPAQLVAVFFLVFQMGCASGVPPVDSSGPSDEEALNALSNGTWIFTADQAMPMRGKTRMLTDRYEVRCNKDSLISYLPYMGRAYSVPYGETKSPLDFTSTRFTVQKEKDAKGRWNLTITPTDNNEVRTYYFTVYDNGSSQLQVQLNNRDGIGFSGRVSKQK